MKRQIATDKSQSDRLLECGVSAESADMMITPHNTLSAEPYNNVLKERGYCPAWSIGCLLWLLPKEIPTDKGTAKLRLRVARESERWIVDYWTWNSPKNTSRCKWNFRDNDPIEACVQLIEWLAENGYALNGFEKGGSDDN